MPSVDMSTGRFTSNALDTTRKQLQHSNFRLWLQADIQSLEIKVCLTPNSGHSVYQIQVPARRRRDGFADIIKVAGIGLVHVAPVNECRNHLAGHLDRHHEAALLTLGQFASASLRPTRMTRQSTLAFSRRRQAVRALASVSPTRRER